MALTVLTFDRFSVHSFVHYLLACLQCHQELCSVGATVEMRMNECPEPTAQVGGKQDTQAKYITHCNRPSLVHRSPGALREKADFNSGKA